MEVNSLDRLRLTVAATIIVVWIASLVIDWTTPSYDTPAALNTFALIIAGFLFGPSLIKARSGNGNRGGDKE